MRRRRFLGLTLALPTAYGQVQDEFTCPMDPDVRAAKAGKCPRCGMTLVAGITEGIEYPVAIKLRPAAPRPGATTHLEFIVSHPRTGARVKEFELVHEKLHHLFVVSQDLTVFRHEHPQLARDGSFHLDLQFPKPGMYRILSDFYPRHGTPQLIENTIVVPGGPITAGTQLTQDLTPKRSENLEVSLSLQPERPIAGMKTLLFCDLQPADHLEPYLGAWGHMLAASDDLVDLMHNHPFLAEGGPRVQFNMIFPRPAVYRLWIQFQRQEIVNTVQFDVAVSELK